VRKMSNRRMCECDIAVLSDIADGVRADTVNAKSALCRLRRLREKWRKCPHLPAMILLVEGICHIDAGIELNRKLISCLYDNSAKNTQVRGSACGVRDMSGVAAPTVYTSWDCIMNEVD
jgi:hypothetical protein